LGAEDAWQIVIAIDRDQDQPLAVQGSRDEFDRALQFSASLKPVLGYPKWCLANDKRSWIRLIDVRYVAAPFGPTRKISGLKGTSQMATLL
jgi:hypothetical protein